MVKLRFEPKEVPYKYDELIATHILSYSGTVAMEDSPSNWLLQGGKSKPLCLQCGEPQL